MRTKLKSWWNKSTKIGMAHQERKFRWNVVVCDGGFGERGAPMDRPDEYRTEAKELMVLAKKLRSTALVLAYEEMARAYLQLAEQTDKISQYDDVDAMPPRPGRRYANK